ncbi:MAG: DUF2764 family protein, partial [Treponema sp.]|nr:DUF2764 family protein [Treponema sp.]
MGSYYYLVAQLPSLVYGERPPMSSAVFRNLAGSLLGKADAALLDQVSLDPAPRGKGAAGPAEAPAYAESAPPSGCAFIDRWREWERTLRLNLARARAQRMKREAAQAEPPGHPAEAVRAALGAAAVEESPLEAELFLDRARWNAIEELQGTSYFSRNTVYAYLLKLLLLERHSLFDTDAGFAEYKSLYASILERAQ